MNLLGALITLALSLVVLFGPRRWAVLATICDICYVPLFQSVEFAGFNFTSIRIVVLVGVIRMVAREEFKSLKFNPIDKAVLTYVTIAIVFYTIREGTLAAFVYELGMSYDIILAYLVGRGYFPTFREFQEFLPPLAVIVAPVALLMLIEHLSGRSPFTLLGMPEPTIRDGRYRASGAFFHAITAGVWGATLLPLYVCLLLTRRELIASIVGVLASLIIIISSNSSGPILALMGGTTALLCWRFREHMRRVRWAILALFAALQLSMNAPVWFIFMKAGHIIGGDGYHRSALIDAAVENFSEWWFMGTSNTAHWVEHGSLSDTSVDMTNQYIRVGVDGGILALVLFILVFVTCFKQLGLSMLLCRARVAIGSRDDKQWMLWSLGCAVSANLVVFVDVAYFDQIRSAWWLLIGLISGTTGDVLVHESNEADTFHEEVERPLSAEYERQLG